MKKQSKQSLTELADAAFQQVAKDVIEIAKRTGTPVIVWEDGAVRKLDPRKIRLPRTKRKGK